MHNFITDFDILMGIIGGLVAVACLFAVWFLLRDSDDYLNSNMKEDGHALWWRMLDKGDK